MRGGHTGVEPHDVGYRGNAVVDGDDLDHAGGVLAVAEGEDGVDARLVVGRVALVVVVVSLFLRLLLFLLLLKCCQDALEGPRHTLIAFGDELIVLRAECSDDLGDVLGRDVEVQVAVRVEDAGVSEDEDESCVGTETEDGVGIRTDRGTGRRMNRR
jgi:hypothetical protein